MTDLRRDHLYTEKELQELGLEVLDRKGSNPDYLDSNGTVCMFLRKGYSDQLQYIGRITLEPVRR